MEISRETGKFTQDLGWMEQFRKHRNIDTLDRSAIVSMIERVLIFRDRRVEIVYRRHDEFQGQVELLAQAQASLSGREAV